MLRTTPELVAGIIELDTDIPVEPFILAASSLVDGVEKRSLSLDSDMMLSDEVIQVIETWLSAHFYCMRDPRPERQRIGPIERKYQSKVDLDLRLSHYGQTAIVLDTTGYLRDVSDGKLRKRVVSVTWVGTELTEI